MKKKKDFFPLMVVIFVIMALTTSGIFNQPKKNGFYSQESQLQRQSNPNAQTPVTPAQAQSPSGQSSSGEAAQYFDLFSKAYSEKKYDLAAKWGEKFLEYEPNNISALGCVGYSYLELKQYAKAEWYYKKVLSLDPSNSSAKKNLEYLNQELEDKNLKSSIDNARAGEKAPRQIYSIIKTNLPDDVRIKTENIFDIIWSVPDGKTILLTMWQNNIPIKVVANNAKDNADMHWHLSNGNGVVDYIDIPISFINRISDPNLSTLQRIQGFEVFVHEFGHAFVIIKNPQSKNSIEEEISTSMIGLNISYKSLMGSYLTREQAKEYSLAYLSGALSSDKHKILPVYSGVNKQLQSWGLTLPYPEEYADLLSMYKKLRAEGETGSVENFEKLINKP